VFFTGPRKAVFLLSGMYKMWPLAHQSGRGND
jgi:hypothetical protein